MGKTRIVSKEAEPFQNRTEAGKLLASELVDLYGKNAVVVGIPRGGVIVAREIARYLLAELDITLTRKIGAPGNPEVAIGAITEDGKVFVNKQYYEWGKKFYLERERFRQMEFIRWRIALFRKIRPKISLRGRTVIVTDDGVATGATMKAALWACRKEQPHRLICSVPVGAPDAIERLSEEADEVVCLRAPDFFLAVSRFYLEFQQIDDETVIQILKESV